ncbi:MAG: SDR family NAD(P)-dependent oxidoreductase [Cyclobacteriaceae bacterium]|nr:SDR family NAD(P)-dependent oxidoreductase [Cyclobacteriaceae bacterium]
MNLKRKIAVVTGFSSEFGVALVSALIAKDAIVYGITRKLEKLNTLQAQLGKSFIPVALDITDQKAIALWVKNTFSESLTPAILINNAGVGYFRKMDELSQEQWHQMINANLNGTFYLTSSFVPLMKRNKNQCHIITIDSVLRKTPRPNSTGYSATKYDIQELSETLYKELRADNIKITCISPSSMETSRGKQSGVKPDSNWLQPNDFTAWVISILENRIHEVTQRPMQTKIESEETAEPSSPVCYANSREVRKEFLDEN